MAKFKIAVKYIESNEEILEVEAKTVSEARRMCAALVKENEEIVERLRRFNIYVSKIVESCRLCPYDYRLEALGCEDLARRSEDEI